MLWAAFNKLYSGCGLVDRDSPDPWPSMIHFWIPIWGDGVIDKDELQAVFTGLGLQIGNAELQSMFQAADSWTVTVMFDVPPEIEILYIVYRGKKWLGWVCWPRCPDVVSFWFVLNVAHLFNQLLVCLPHLVQCIATCFTNANMLFLCFAGCLLCNIDFSGRESWPEHRLFWIFAVDLQSCALANPKSIPSDRRLLVPWQGHATPKYCRTLFFFGWIRKKEKMFLPGQTFFVEKSDHKWLKLTNTLTDLHPFCNGEAWPSQRPQCSDPGGPVDREADSWRQHLNKNIWTIGQTNGFLIHFWASHLSFWIPRVFFVSFFGFFDHLIAAGKELQEFPEGHAIVISSGCAREFRRTAPWWPHSHSSRR